MAKRKQGQRTKSVEALLEKLKPESFGEFASMCFAGLKLGGRHGKA